eukprot:m.359740 g.359740  ORF g.359740 m.359740 type:complete len:116 (-) comp56003_c0_seq2:1097-1444(-)
MALNLCACTPNTHKPQPHRSTADMRAILSLRHRHHPQGYTSPFPHEHLHAPAFPCIPVEIAERGPCAESLCVVEAPGVPITSVSCHLSLQAAAARSARVGPLCVCCTRIRYSVDL